jgi:tetratricopeptide (TPR) repeat protein
MAKIVSTPLGPSAPVGQPPRAEAFDAKQKLEAGAPGPLRQAPARGAELSRAQAATIGSVANKETVPTRTLVGVYHKGERAGSESARLLDRGFAADTAGQPDRALRDYELAFGVFRVEVSSKHGERLRAKGIDPDAFLMKDNPVSVKILLDRSGMLDEVPALRNTLKKYFNRGALATKHVVDRMPDRDAAATKNEYGHAALLSEVALSLDPGYGAAHYNMACVALRGFGDVDEALASLERAIADRSFDFKKLAREGDTDWNGLRDDARFRALVGLPPQ